MSSAVDAEIRVKFVDAGASKGLKAVTQAAEQSATKSATAAKQAASQSVKAASDAANQSTRSVQAAHDNHIKLYKDMAEARKSLGIRAEQSVREEINKTTAAYKLLASSGSLSARELGRAYDAQLSKVKALKKELSDVGKYSKMSTAVTGAVIAGGVLTTVSAARRAAEQNMSLDERLGLRANAAYKEKDAAGRRAGETRMRAGIDKAVRGGMTIEEAMDALDTMIAANQVGGVDKAIDLMPFIAKVKSGQGASGVDAASLLSTLIGTGMARNAQDAMRQTDIIAAGGAAGKFEMSDLTKELPSILPLAITKGYVGDAGLKRIVTMLEQGAITSGSPAEAANNLRNFLSKVDSGDTAKDFKKMGRGDLEAKILQARAKGQTPDEMYLDIIKQETQHNPKLKAALKNVAKAKDEQEREERIQALNELAKGQAIGKLFQDMQAKGAFLGILNEEFGKEVSTALDKSSGIINKDAAYISDKTGFKTRVAKETGKLAEMDAVSNLNPLISSVADGFTQLASANPALVGATTLATGAILALAGSAGVAAVSMGGKSALSSGILAKTSSTLSATSGAGLLKGAGVMGAIYGASEMAQSGIDWVNQQGLTAIYGEEKANRLMGKYNRFMGGSRSDSPTVSGDLVANAGQLYNNPLPGGLVDSIAKPQQPAIDATANLQIGLAPGLVLQSQSTQSNGLNMNTSVGNTGNFFGGAPR